MTHPVNPLTRIREMAFEDPSQPLKNVLPILEEETSGENTPVSLLNEIHVCFERMKADEDLDMNAFVADMEGLIQFGVIQGWINPLYEVQEA